MRPLPHRAHLMFVETEGWTEKRRSGKKKQGDHRRFHLELATGDVLYTRVSHGAGAINDPNLVAAILREQLQVTEDDFWACVDDGTLPPRPSAEPEAPAGPAVDAKLMRNLVRKVGLSPDELEGMTQERAVQIWTDWLSSGGHQ